MIFSIIRCGQRSILPLSLIRSTFWVWFTDDLGSMLMHPIYWSNLLYCCFVWALVCFRSWRFNRSARAWIRLLQNCIVTFLNFLLFLFLCVPQRVSFFNCLASKFCCVCKNVEAAQQAKAPERVRAARPICMCSHVAYLSIYIVSIDWSASVIITTRIFFLKFTDGDPRPLATQNINYHCFAPVIALVLSAERQSRLWLCSHRRGLHR